MYAERYICLSVLSQKPYVSSYFLMTGTIAFSSCIIPAKLGYRQAALDLQKSN